MIGAGFGAAAGSRVEAATGSELAGQAVAVAIDFFNPISDAYETEQFLEEVALDSLEAIYDVELSEEQDENQSDQVKCDGAPCPK